MENHRAYQWAYHHQVHHQVRHGQRIQRIHETKQWRDIQKIIENPMLTYSTSCSKRDGMGPSLPDLGTEPNLRTANSSTWLFDDFVWGCLVILRHLSDNCLTTKMMQPVAAQNLENSSIHPLGAVALNAFLHHAFSSLHSQQILDHSSESTSNHSKSNLYFWLVVSSHPSEK